MCDQCHDRGIGFSQHGKRWSTIEELYLWNELDTFIETQALMHRRSKVAIFLRLSKLMDERLDDPYDNPI